ncbi:hypothetical protein DQ353_07370 [Arthrobacter sp. AQ5-05]|nr:hypothetical protein DQ353_07370 [Arthrobacter sp. AQ5-05]
MPRPGFGAQPRNPGGLPGTGPRYAVAAPWRTETAAERVHRLPDPEPAGAPAASQHGTEHVAAHHEREADLGGVGARAHRPDHVLDRDCPAQGADERGVPGFGHDLGRVSAAFHRLSLPRVPGIPGVLPALFPSLDHTLEPQARTLRLTHAAVGTRSP